MKTGGLHFGEEPCSAADGEAVVSWALDFVSLVAGVFQWIRYGNLGDFKDIYRIFENLQIKKKQNQGCSEFVDGFPWIL